MGLSFKEASAWGSAFVTAFVFVPYFVTAAGAPEAPIWALLVPAIIAAFAWQVLLHIVLGVRKLPEPIEARDREISKRANAIACPILTVGLVVAVGQAMFPDWLSRMPVLNEFPQQSLLINLVMLAIVAAELMKCATQILLYRRAAWHGVEG